MPTAVADAVTIDTGGSKSIKDKVIEMDTITEDQCKTVGNSFFEDSKCKLK